MQSFPVERHPLRGLVFALGCLAILPGRAAAQLPPPAAHEHVLAPEPPVTSTGSFSPGVYLDDISYTIRMAYTRSVTVSWHDPDVAYVASWDGYVWKTTDGGKTYDESRLIVQPFPFFGDSAERLYFGVHRQAGGVSEAFERYTGHRQGKLMRSGGGSGGGGGSGVGAAANVNFGIGVPGAAPRLQILVRKFGKPTSGLNLKQLLWLRGSRPTEIRILVVHPKDPKIVFACTAFGLYKTVDGGLNWVRTFIGTSPIGRMAFHLAVDPENPDKVFLATGEGVYISTDRGNNFMKTTSKGVGEGVIDWIYFSPYDSRYVFAGTDNGLLRSSDGGDNWEWIYFTTFPTARVVRSIIIDPFDKKRGYIATHDGLFTTPDLIHGGLESWSRFGGLQFTGVEMSKISACPKHKGHLWALSNMKLPRVDKPGMHDAGGSFVVETIDGGTSWKILFAGNTQGSMQWYDNDPRDPDLLWLAWSRSLARMRVRTGPAAEDKKVVIPDDPTVGEMLQAVMGYTLTDPGKVIQWRQLSRLKGLMPRLNVQYRHLRTNDLGLLHDALYPNFPYRQDTGQHIQFNEFRFLFTWDLSSLVFNLESTMFGRIDRLNAEFAGQVKMETHMFYSEWRRLRILMANDPPEDIRIRLMYKLRIEELTSYLDFLSGNFLSRWAEGHRGLDGRNSEWWKPWKLKHKKTLLKGVL